ncbi:MAG: tetratricopeptide repeat protein, partial [Candidatus Latescibacterota bacterium]
MKRFFFSILIGVFCTVSPSYAGAAPMNGAEAAARYNKAGALYRDGHFREALEIYEQLMTRGIRNPDLYYNAANSAYRAEMIGKSVLYLERALRLAPSDREANANLVFLNSRKQDRDPSEENAALAFLERWYGSINTDSAALWSGAAFALMMLLAVGMIFLGGWKRMSLGVASGLCGLVFLTSTGILVHKMHRAATVREAVVMVPEVHAYSGPGTENTLIFTLHEG